MLKRIWEKVKSVKHILLRLCISLGLVIRYVSMSSWSSCTLHRTSLATKSLLCEFQEKALEQLKLTEGKTVAVGQKMDLVFYTLQLAFFYMDFDLVSKSIDKAKK